MAGEGGGRLGTEELERVVAPHRMEWLREEIRRGQYEESLELFNRKLALRADDAQFLYARGEVYRLRDRTEDLQPALDDLQRRGRRAAAARPVPFARAAPEAPGDKAAAAAAFQKYLALVPDAGDAGLIKTYLSEPSREETPCHPPGRAGRRLCLRRQGRGRAGAQQPHERAAALGMEPHRREPEPYELWTQDGVSIDQLRMWAGVTPGQALVRVPNTPSGQKPPRVPTFVANMSPTRS